MDNSINVSNIRSGKDGFVVLISYQESKELLDVLAARKRAIALIRATEIASSEVRILKGLNPNFNPRIQGFGKVKLTKDDEMSMGLLALMRDTRPPLPENINPIFGFKTKLPLVEYFIDGTKLSLQIDEVQDHAQRLLEASEACESDKFFDYFGDRIGLDPKLVASLLAEFSRFRKKNNLENLFNI